MTIALIRACQCGNDLSQYSSVAFFEDSVDYGRGGEGYPADEMEALFTGSSGGGGGSREDALSGFGEELVILLRSQLWGESRGEAGGSMGGVAADGAAGLEKIELWSRMLETSLSRMRRMNLDPRLVLEGLYYRMKSVV